MWLGVGAGCRLRFNGLGVGGLVVDRLERMTGVMWSSACSEIGDLQPIVVVFTQKIP